MGILPNEECSKEAVNLYRAVLSGLCLPLANYLVSFLTPDWSMILPKMRAQLFADSDPTIEPEGCVPALPF